MSLTLEVQRLESNLETSFKVIELRFAGIIPMIATPRTPEGNAGAGSPLGKSQCGTALWHRKLPAPGSAGCFLGETSLSDCESLALPVIVAQLDTSLLSPTASESSRGTSFTVRNAACS